MFVVGSGSCGSEPDAVVGQRDVSREDAEVVLERVRNQNSIEWVGVVARQLGGCFEQPEGGSRRMRACTHGPRVGSCAKLAAVRSYA
jgi:hypothetical protein